MAFGGLLALLDDITVLLDDIAVLSKMAAGKTSGIVGDDLAVNASQMVGLAAKREIPVILAVARGSLINKAVLVPLALAISAFLPWAVMPLLMMGGFYLCFEGVEKILHRHNKHEKKDHPALAAGDPVQFEKQKIKEAVRTDFILSAEIIALTLDMVAAKAFLVQLAVLSLIAVIMTLAVYGLVAIIIKLDDFGFWLSGLSSPRSQWLGGKIVLAAPLLLRGLAALGTVAMFMVGGGIIGHGIPPLNAFLHDLMKHFWLHAFGAASIGIVMGLAVFIVVKAVQWTRDKLKGAVGGQA